MTFAEFSQRLRARLVKQRPDFVDYFEDDAVAQKHRAREEWSLYAAHRDGASVDDIVEAIVDGYAYERYVLRWSLDTLMEQSEVARAKWNELMAAAGQQPPPSVTLRLIPKPSDEEE